ncbi:MAG TPA: DNA primase, partial [Actinobacteria bacterium]|nr:DNA primase [Actinomycetota bacterium]
ETPIYKKSQVLYGLDMARKEISKQQQAVIVEGYTDVMACHLAGITTAVATCGTAFGSEHIKVLRRLLMDDEQMRGEVVFTFDGDAAGQKAALRAFDEDQRFVTNTFVAVEPSGMDPCDLRLAKGDEAVVALVDRRVPLFQFAIKSILAAHDLDRAEGRIAALREAAPVVAKIKDAALRPEYTRLLAGWLGLDVAAVSAAVGQRPAPTQRPSFNQAPAAESKPAPAPAVPAADGPAFTIEREALKCALQLPAVVEEWYSALEPSAFTHPRAREVHTAIVLAGLPAAQVDGLLWIDAVLEAAPDDEVRRMIRELSVDPLPSDAVHSDRYATSLIARLLELDAGRRILEVRGRLQRTESEEQGELHQQLFAELLELETYRRSLQAAALGERP